MSTLYVIATPIGNLEDVSDRARRTLAEVDALACEDTRRTRVLLERHEIPRPAHVFPCHEHNEERVWGRVLGLLTEGASVGIVSNAGYPGVSDPGYVLISRAVEAGIRVEVIPGPSAVETALLTSGLPTSSYTFKGFPPRKGGRLRTFLGQDGDLPHTQVFFESPMRIVKFLAAALEVLGDRRAAVCIELTKKFERVHRGYISDLIEELTDRRIKGEVTIVVAGNHPKFTRQEERGPEAAEAEVVLAGG
ncbi:MAG: 16S rRNA (cytidine(1402)-2'-O)-methyltransferase [Lentisphaerae bacterium]|mgnify:CR=1 FL=1|jgi:16S rRNA (cytidine1402-2'-O)-methyltransferase|nr:16S rRNA (cytidine(1402)-2'-O)-methyltransferase [Lentisphaerota bacterium]MBT5611552.1 16S rRNA (cytidine(1402)-2'-O)-methyltransferase [Lentisphaerota bacterium]MBT7059579.1 16S rRNA (cytidine(1402)-2'-O)-methyltransferase [Lentisphaerota bacterium]MBT7844979.1 16S rRNA (cytidine(1402)-2'-O)-methyltransferase [Lentisphaerota bacterium]